MDCRDDFETSEISILPDGRICLFGASQQVLELFDAIELGDPALKKRIECLRAANERRASKAENAYNDINANERART